MKTKNIIIILTLSLLIACQKGDSNIEDSKNCNITSSKIYHGDIIFSTQKQITDFEKLSYTSIIGNIQLTEEAHVEDPIKDLNGALDCITYIEGGVSINGNNSLQSLEGFLRNVTSISFLRINNNTNLITLGGFDNLSSTSSVVVTNNNSLVNLEGFCQKITSLERLNIEGNQNLRNLEGLNNIETVIGLYIKNNQSLLDFTGLNLTSILRFITIDQNNSLENFDAISSNMNTRLESIIIWNNPSLISIKGLGNISRIIDALSIKNNNSLVNLKGLESLNYVNEFIRSGIYIRENDSLQNLDALSNLVFVKYLEFSRNSNLNDFCGIENLVLTSSYFDIYIGINLYNPSINDIINGQCH